MRKVFLSHKKHGDILNICLQMNESNWIPNFWYSEKVKTKNMHNLHYIKESDGQQADQENFKGNKTTLCDTILVDTCHYIFAQVHTSEF